MLRKSRIEESKELHSEMLQELEAIRKEKMKNVAETETSQGVLHSQQFQLKKNLEELMTLREEEWSLQRSNENDSCLLVQFNDSMSEKRTSLSRVEDLNRGMTDLIDMRASLNSEVKLINEKCEKLRNEEIMPKMERMKKLEVRKETLERRKSGYIERRIEVKNSTLEAKVSRWLQ